VGAGLLAKAVGQSMNPFLADRIREQARSHRGVVVNVKSGVGSVASKAAG